MALKVGDEKIKKAMEIVRPFQVEGSISETVFLELVDRISDEFDRIENEKEGEV